MNVHVQTLVKVNAQVDKGIAPLVEALNAYPGVFTTSSCEGRKHQNAYVAFDVGDAHRQELVAFVNTLSSALGQDDKVNDLPFTLSVEWYAGGNTPNAYLHVPRQHIHALADAIRSASASVARSASRDRMSGSSHHTGYRALGRSTANRRHSRPAKCDGARASSPQ